MVEIGIDCYVMDDLSFAWGWENGGGVGER
jgi:hypothetical protein